VAALPVAFAFKPTAVELVPVEAAAAQDVPAFKSVALDWHPANAGTPPNTVTIPAAIASPRKAPPASALAPISRARRLTGMQIDSPGAATSPPCEPFRFASRFPMSSPPALRDIAVAPPRNKSEFDTPH
jgi:hypothetical protein